jgi:peptidoglycan/LPS O-acetylase OafA/YrhL
MKQQLHALTSTRGIAALLVVVFHFGCTIFPFSTFEHFFRSGNLAVGYFFVLSGFVMYYTYHLRPPAYSTFVWRRMLRIIPAYYLALSLAALWMINHEILSGPLFIRQLALNTSFTQALFPGYALTINSPGWTLSIEMFFYALLPLLLLFAIRRRKAFVWFTVLFYLLSQTIHAILIAKYHPVWGTPIHEFIFYFPLFHFNQFLVGMAACMFYFSAKNGRLKYATLPLTILIVFMVNFAPTGISLHNGLLAPLFALLIVGIASGNSNILSVRPFVFIGEISYGIYILQEPLHRYSVLANAKWFHLSETTFFYGYLLLLLLSATVSFYIIERPLRKLLIRRN